MPEANFKLNAYEDLVQNAPSMMIDNKSSHSLGFIDSFANTKKWSENSSDIPLLPSIELSETKQDERIRRYLFENSYSIDATKMSRGKNFMVTTADRSCKIEQQSEQKNGNISIFRFFVLFFSLFLAISDAPFHLQKH